MSASKRGVRAAGPLLPAALGILAALLYWLTRQGWLYGDGPFLVTVLARAHDAGKLPVWRHVLYLPLCELALRLGVARADEAGQIVSALSGGILVAATAWLCTRAVGRRAALLAVLLLATSPAVWFFATTVELHALAAAVAAAAAVLVVRVPARLRPTALAAGLAVSFLAHESAWLLVPGLVLLALQPELAGPGKTALAWPRPRDAVIVAGAAAGAALGLAIQAWLRSVGTGAGAMSAAELVVRMRARGFDPAMLWRAALAPHLGMLVLAVVSLARGPRLLLLAVLVPYLAFALFVFEDANAGGYVLPAAWALALGAARELERLPQRTWIALALVVVQVLLAARILTSPGQDAVREDRERRAAAAAAALPHGGLVVSVEPSSLTIEGLVPGVHEISVVQELFHAVQRGETPEAFALRLVPLLESRAREFGTVAIDLSYRSRLAAYPDAVVRMDALVAAGETRLAHATMEFGGRKFAFLRREGAD